ncbi:hypothetical protein BASA81_000688 [Batrachochytrium salamandrivorans]|nr:hypothetical protein BASA81_000688 [Batrachochytrium salamandrivorans]
MKKRLSKLFGKLSLSSTDQLVVAKPCLSPSAASPPSFTPSSSIQQIFAPFERNPAKLWQELGLNEDAVEVLFFLYLCKCQSLLELSPSEFQLGMQRLQCKSLTELARELHKQFRELPSPQFHELYSFCFQASREGTIKTVDKDTCVYLLPILLASTTHFNRSKRFCEFLNQQNSVQHIKYDEWQSFLKFCEQVPELAKYDANDSWPLMIDEFVQWQVDVK